MTSWMLSCQKATELIEKRELHKLSLWDGMQLKLHLSMCAACSRYQRQSRLLSRFLKSSQDIQMPENLKDKIKKDISE